MDNPDLTKHFLFKYLNKNVDIENPNDIVFDIELIHIIHVLYDVYSEMTFGKPDDRYIPKYNKKTDKLFLDNINNIDIEFDSYSRIDKDPIFRTLLEYDDPDLKGKIKSITRIGKIDKILKDEDGR